MFNPKQLKGWTEKATVAFFKKNRRSYKELFPSEKYFLTKKLIKNQGSILDIGCAAGGFYSIFRSLNKKIHYTGIDISEESIAFAREQFGDSPLVNFLLYEGNSLEEIKMIKGKKFDLVFCSGLMHLIDNWKDILSSMVALASKFVIVDFRICLERENYFGEFIFDFDAQGQSQHSTNYHVINLKDLLSYLNNIDRIVSLSLYGYKGKAIHMAKGIKDVHMMFFKMEIGTRDSVNMKIQEMPDEIIPHLNGFFKERTNP